jgi:hypothetical protein
MLVDSFSRSSKILMVAQVLQLSLSNILNKIRMRHFCTLLIIFFHHRFPAACPEFRQLSGQVTSDNHEPVIGATAALLAAADSSLAKVAVSDEHGNFEMLNVKPAAISLRIRVVGYENYRSDVITVEGSDAHSHSASSFTAEQHQLIGGNGYATKTNDEVKTGMTIFNVQRASMRRQQRPSNCCKISGVCGGPERQHHAEGKKRRTDSDRRKTDTLERYDLADLLRSMQSTDIEAIEIYFQSFFNI